MSTTSCERCEDFAADARKVLSQRCAPDERHCSCAPHLRAEIDRLTAELEEARLTLAAEQGRSEGAPSEGWEFGYGWKDGNPTYLAWRKGRNEIRPCWEYDEPSCWIVNGEPADTTARAAMLAADASK